jgi:hypothetical protein
MGETLAVLEASIQRLAGVLAIPNFKEWQEDDRRRAVLDWPRLRPGRFLVIDNLDSPQALKVSKRGKDSPVDHEGRTF